MKRLWSAIGPALIVAAVVLGPGSILTSSRVGAQHGLTGIPIVMGATVLMMSMVILSARLGVVCEGTPCAELSRRLGRPVAAGLGVILFFIVAIFQLSNNIAVVGGLEPLLGARELPTEQRVLVLAGVNLLVIVFLYGLRDLYRWVERLMKLLVGVMALAFLTNLVSVLAHDRPFEPVVPSESGDWFAVLGLVGTTFSLGGAFYQAWLVREKGWTIDDVRSSTIDSILSISVLGMMTCVVLLTAWRVFYGHPDPPPLRSVGDVARVLEPSFGSGARIVFAGGILAGAVSSFLGNALIGGTILSDAVGAGSRLQDRWPVHLTTAALLTGFAGAVAALYRENSTVTLITLAQALTVVGLPAVAASLVYLATRPDIRARGAIPPWLIGMAVISLAVSVFVASRTLEKIVAAAQPAVRTTQPQTDSAQISAE